MNEAEALYWAHKPLTGKEISILQAMANGEQQKAYADRTSHSPHTIKNEVTIIRAKLGVRSSIHAVAVALRKGLIE